MRLDDFSLFFYTSKRGNGVLMIPLFTRTRHFDGTAHGRACARRMAIRQRGVERMAVILERPGVGAEKPINLGQGQLRGCMPCNRYDTTLIL